MSVRSRRFRWLLGLLVGAALGLAIERSITSHAGSSSEGQKTVTVHCLGIRLYDRTGPPGEMRAAELRWFWGTALVGLAAGAVLGLAAAAVVPRLGQQRP